MAERELFKKANEQFQLKREFHATCPDLQLTRQFNFPTVRKIKQFHLSDVPLVHQPKNPTHIFPDDPRIKIYDSVSWTIHVFLRSFKQNYVLCLS